MEVFEAGPLRVLAVREFAGQARPTRRRPHIFYPRRRLLEWPPPTLPNPARTAGHVQKGATPWNLFSAPTSPPASKATASSSARSQ